MKGVGGCEVGMLVLYVRQADGVSRKESTYLPAASVGGGISLTSKFQKAHLSIERQMYDRRCPLRGGG